MPIAMYIFYGKYKKDTGKTGNGLFQQVQIYQ